MKFKDRKRISRNKFRNLKLKMSIYLIKGVKPKTNWPC